MTTQANALAALEREQRRQLVDEYGALTVELVPWKQKQARCEALAGIIRGWYKEYDGESNATVSGERFQVVLSEKQFESRIDLKGAFKAFGRARFLQVCSLTLKALEENLSPTLVAGLVTKARTGTRKLVVHPISHGGD